jgi:DNA (cytosine-5)-methyltransferase 1
MKALDLFAGCGGASLGLTRAGYQVLGVEFDAQAHATHEAAGMECILADVRHARPDLAHYDHLHASPPCQTFSVAGKGTGRDSVAALAAAVKDVLNGAQPADLDIDVADERTLLTLEPARWIAALKPATISLEQVRGVLPIWEAYAEGLRDLGYSAWAELINAEQYGIPQNRIRAWLGARRDGIEAQPPTPTHSKYHNRTPDKLDPGVAKWVSMADALDWDDGLYLTGLARPIGMDGGYVVTIDGVDRRGRDLTLSSRPSKTLGCKVTPEWKVYKSGKDAACGPLVGRLTPAEALALQGFPTSWPLQGTRTAQFKQIGNAVPPHIARVVVEALTDAPAVAYRPFLTADEVCHDYAITAAELADATRNGLDYFNVPGKGVHFPTVWLNEFFAGKLRAVA